MARWEESTSQGDAQIGAGPEQEGAPLPMQQTGSAWESVPVDDLVKDLYRQVSSLAGPLRERAVRQGVQINVRMDLTIGADVKVVTSEEFVPMTRGQVQTDSGTLEEAAVQADAKAKHSEDAPVDGREDAMQRARRSAARAVIAANNRLGLETPQDIRDVAGPEDVDTAKPGRFRDRFSARRG